MVATPRYWLKVASSPTHQAQLARIPSGSRVLEIGAAGGHMTQALIAKGCEVVAVETEPELAGRLREVCPRVIEANVEDGSLPRRLGGERFDVILLGDVLEHLQHPERALAGFHPLLHPDGGLVVSLPNVAHASVRLSLLQGAFDYRPEGLLDATHLRFFTRASLCATFAGAGWSVKDLALIERGAFDTEIPVEPATIPVAVLRRLAEDPDARVYQFVFRAVPAVEGQSGVARHERGAGGGPGTRRRGRRAARARPPVQAPRASAADQRPEGPRPDEAAVLARLEDVAGALRGRLGRPLAPAAQARARDRRRGVQGPITPVRLAGPRAMDAAGGRAGPRIWACDILFAP